MCTWFVCALSHTSSYVRIQIACVLTTRAVRRPAIRLCRPNSAPRPDAASPRKPRTRITRRHPLPLLTAFTICPDIPLRPSLWMVLARTISLVQALCGGGVACALHPLPSCGIQTEWSVLLPHPCAWPCGRFGGLTCGCGVVSSSLVPLSERQCFWQWQWVRRRRTSAPPPSRQPSVCVLAIALGPALRSHTPTSCGLCLPSAIWPVSAQRFRSIRAQFTPPQHLLWRRRREVRDRHIRGY